MKKTIKELLSIDLEFLLRNSTFLKDQIEDKSDSRKFLLYDLNSKFIDVIDQIEIRIFEGVPQHLIFKTTSIITKQNLFAAKFELRMNDSAETRFGGGNNSLLPRSNFWRKDKSLPYSKANKNFE